MPFPESGRKDKMSTNAPGTAGAGTALPGTTRVRCAALASARRSTAEPNRRRCHLPSGTLQHSGMRSPPSTSAALPAPTAGTTTSRRATGVTASPRSCSAPGSDSPSRKSAGSRTVHLSAISTPSLTGRASCRSRLTCSGSSSRPAVALTSPGKNSSSRQLRLCQRRHPTACQLPTDWPMARTPWP